MPPHPPPAASATAALKQTIRCPCGSTPAASASARKCRAVRAENSSVANSSPDNAFTAAGGKATPSLWVDLCQPTPEELEQASRQVSFRIPDRAGISEIEVRRSAKRRSTVTARVEADRIVLLLPATLGARAEQEWVDTMVQRIADKRARPAGSDADLAARAAQVAAHEATARRARPDPPSVQ